jgi:hypothetical protein
MVEQQSDSPQDEPQQQGGTGSGKSPGKVQHDTVLKKRPEKPKGLRDSAT